MLLQSRRRQIAVCEAQVGRDLQLPLRRRARESLELGDRRVARGCEQMPPCLTPSLADFPCGSFTPGPPLTETEDGSPMINFHPAAKPHECLQHLPICEVG